GVFYIIYMFVYVLPVSFILFGSVNPFKYLYSTIKEFSRLDIKGEIKKFGFEVVELNLFPYTSKIYVGKKCLNS
ncbi:MAG: hypothetical protein NZ870_04320, partial [bacterium]|nr:hypothetical protein [bacterium]